MLIWARRLLQVFPYPSPTHLPIMCLEARLLLRSLGFQSSTCPSVVPKDKTKVFEASYFIKSNSNADSQISLRSWNHLKDHQILRISNFIFFLDRRVSPFTSLFTHIRKVCGVVWVCLHTHMCTCQARYSD